MSIPENEYLAVISAHDRDLTTVELRDIRNMVDELGSDGLWPESIASALPTYTTEQLIDLHWITERYYADLIRESRDPDIQDFYLTIGYARVISLCLLYEPDMGFDPAELHFVLAALDGLGSRTGIAREHLRVLEVGCGAGSLLVNLAGNGYRALHGIDLAPSAVRVARDRLDGIGLHDRVRLGVPQDLLAEASPPIFDAIMICDVLEHIPPERVADFLATLRTLLRPDGRLLVVTPSALTGPHDHTRLFMPPGTAPMGFHLREYSLADLVEVLTAAGFGRFQGSGPASWLRSRTKGTRLSGADITVKRFLEPAVARLPFVARKRVVDTLYYKGLCCDVVN